MTPPAPPEGILRVRLGLAGGRIEKIEIFERPLAPLAQLLAGREIADALALLPRLFTLCPVAQSVAALGAAEAALGLRPKPQRRALRTLLALAENLSEHARHLSLDGPLAFGLPPDVDGAKASRRLKTSLTSLLGGEATALGLTQAVRPDRRGLAGWLGAAKGLVRDGLMGGVDVERMRSLDEATAWAMEGRTTAARMLREALAQGRQDFGASSVAPMGVVDMDHIERRLGCDAWRDFATRPSDALDRCLETGPLARQHEHPLILRCERRGLAARLLARLIECSHALAAMTAALAMLDECEAQDVPAGDGLGLGVAEAARGRLFHRVVLEKGKVKDWRLLAPTEWNFHAKGPFALGLIGLDAKDGAEAAKMARIQGLALDPCVGLEIEVA